MFSVLKHPSGCGKLPTRGFSVALCPCKDLEIELALRLLQAGKRSIPMETAILSVLLALAAFMSARLLWLWYTCRGDRLVTCPETSQPVGVALDVKHAAWTGIGQAPGLRLRSCTRWPERQDCGQACLGQIEAALDGCLIRNILAHWYANKNCAICGKSIGEIHWADRRPALLSPERRTVEWSQVQPETVPAVLETHAPVCWNCHILQTFRNEHPELVVDRSRPFRL
jgi:hypothetical protein